MNIKDFFSKIFGKAKARPYCKPSCAPDCWGGDSQADHDHLIMYDKALVQLYEAERKIAVLKGCLASRQSNFDQRHKADAEKIAGLTKDLLGQDEEICALRDYAVETAGLICANTYDLKEERNLTAGETIKEALGMMKAEEDHLQEQFEEQDKKLHSCLELLNIYMRSKVGLQVKCDYCLKKAKEWVKVKHAGDCPLYKEPAQECSGQTIKI